MERYSLINATPLKNTQGEKKKKRTDVPERNTELCTEAAALVSEPVWLVMMLKQQFKRLKGHTF